jgi:signal transduction histidine kinase
MNPETRSSSRGYPKRRLAVLAILLASSLIVGVGLAVQAINTARRHRATAERALTDYAGFGAFILASRTYRQLGGAVVSSFSGWARTNRPGPIPSGAECPGGNSYLETAPGGGPLQFTGPALDAQTSSFLADTTRFAMALLEEVGWRFRFIAVPSGPIDGFFITSYQGRSNQYGLRGFAACFGTGSSTFRQVMLAEQALPPAVAGALPADSLFSIAVTTGRRPDLYRSPVTYTSRYLGRALLGTEFGDLTVHLALRPGIANRLVIGGVPAPPTALVVGLVGLSALFVITALWQVRREYALIAVRSEFVSNVSHELRTPLSQILIFTELLRLGRLRSDQERRRSLEVIDQEARRLIRLVENVLQFSGAERKARRLARESMPLGGVVQETVDAFRPLAAARDARFELEVPQELGIRADRSAVRQILLNLLDNAIKYGPRGQTITVRAEPAGRRTRLEVEDQGPGIPRDDRERIWDGYYRLDREADSAVAGSGIGLAVVRSLASDLGGATWVEDTETGGSRFVVEFDSAEAAG